MNTDERTAKEIFYKELQGYMQDGDELSVKKIYSLFPDINTKTVSWRLHELVQQGKIHRTGHGYYALTEISENNAAGYVYLQKKSQFIYDVVIDYGYDFYITGLDSLTGELLHIPEKYPVLLVTEDAVVAEMQEILSQKELIVVTEKDRNIIENSTRGSKSLDMLAEDAIKQIKEKKYEEGVKLIHGHEKVVCIGVGFKGKELKMLK